MTETRALIPPELVRSARAGDRKALAELVEAAYPLVRRWSLVATGDPMEADDVTQDTLVKMVRGLGRFGGRSSFETWLFSTTRNCVRDRARRERRATRISAEAWRVDAASAAVDPTTHLEEVETLTLLRMFVEELPPRQRHAFDIVELQGRTAKDAAQLLGIAPVSVRAHLFKARRALRARILAERPELVEGAP